MRIQSFLASLTIGFASLIPAAAQQTIDLINVDGLTVNEACRMISFATGVSITPTSQARSIECSILISNATIEEAISKICVSSGLVYRKDAVHGGFLILSLEEYQQNIIVDAGEKIRVFTVEPANVSSIARAIEAIFPFDAVLEEGEGILDFKTTSEIAAGSGGSSQSSGGSGRGVGSGRGSNSGSSIDFGSQNGRGQGAQAQRNSGGNALTQIAALETEQQTTSGDQKKSTPSGSAIYVNTNIEHNQVIVRTANADAIRQIEQLVARLDRAVPQVLLEMQILTLDIRDERKQGVSWTFGSEGDTQTQFSPSIARPVGQDFVYQFLSSDISARLELLESNRNVEVIARPSIVATNNREAEIVVGVERVIIVGASTQTIPVDNGNPIITESVDTEIRTVGTTLRILPRINSGDIVTLYVEQETTEIVPGGSIPLNGSPFDIDAISTQSVAATVAAKNNNTIAVGGLIRSRTDDSASKVPVLGSIPVVGRAFRGSGKENTKEELILLITPHLMGSKHNGQLVTDAYVNEHSDHSSIRAGQDHLNVHNRSLQAHRQLHNGSGSHSSVLPHKSYAHGAKSPPIEVYQNYEETTAPAPSAEPRRERVSFMKRKKR